MPTRYALPYPISMFPFGENNAKTRYNSLRCQHFKKVA